MGSNPTFSATSVTLDSISLLISVNNDIFYFPPKISILSKVCSSIMLHPISHFAVAKRNIFTRKRGVFFISISHAAASFSAVVRLPAPQMGIHALKAISPASPSFRGSRYGRHAEHLYCQQQSRRHALRDKGRLLRISPFLPDIFPCLLCLKNIVILLPSLR